MGDLRRIPGIGPNIEADLNAIGIHTVADLRDRDPEELYRLDCEAKGFREDPCQLYVFRLAVYYAMTPSPPPPTPPPPPPQHHPPPTGDKPV